MPIAKKLPSGSYRVRVYSHTDEDGKKHYKSFTADTKKEAERMALAYTYEEENDCVPFKDLMDVYLESKSNVLSPSTYRSYTSMSNTLLKEYPHFCNKTNITRTDVQNLINDLAKTRKPKSVKNYNAFVSVILGDSRHFKVTLPQSIKNKYRIPDQAEFKVLLDAVKDTELEIPVMLGSFCMMRRSEICALTLDDIEGDMIHIRKGLVLGDNGYVTKTTKTESSDRYIQAPQFLIDKINKKGYITTLTPAAISDAFHRVVVRIGLNGMVFHGLRHFGASYRHSVLNIPTAHIQRDGGWSDAHTLEQIYRHALDDEHRKYTEKTNRAFESFISNV